MRIVFLMILTAVLVPVFGQTNPEGLTCYENLAAPEFPRAALEAHIDGTVWTTTQVNPQGSIEKIETQVVSAWGDGPKLLTAPVEKAIRAAKIKPACAGKSIAAIFRYQLHGEATASPSVTTRTEGNLMWIESQPAAGAAIKTSH